MEISDNNSNIKIDAYSKQIQVDNKKEAPPQKETQNAAKDDSVKLSKEALELQKANEKLKEIPDVNEDKVNELKNRIENGSYKIDSEKTADNMIRESIVNQYV